MKLPWEPGVRRTLTPQEVDLVCFEYGLNREEFYYIDLLDGQLTGVLAVKIDKINVTLAVEDTST